MLAMATTRSSRVRVKDLHILWYAKLRFSGRDWFKRKEDVSAVVDALAGAAIWKELDVIGSRYEAGVKRGDLASVKKIVGGGAYTYTLAKGPPSAAAAFYESDAYVALEVTPGGVTILSHTRGGVLEKLGTKSISDLFEVLVAIQGEVGDRAELVEATVRPTGDPFEYPRKRPPREASWPLDSVVDIVPASGGSSEVAKKLAKAKLPAGVARTARGGLLELRWCEDPGDLEAMSAAMAKHDAWLGDLLDAEVADGWNEQGDRTVSIDPDADDVAAVDGSKAISDAQWKKLKSKGVRALLVKKRDQALSLREAAKKQGIQLVLYKDGGEYWDPDPPGIWIES